MMPGGVLWRGQDGLAPLGAPCPRRHALLGGGGGVQHRALASARALVMTSLSFPRGQRWVSSTWCPAHNSDGHRRRPLAGSHGPRVTKVVMLSLSSEDSVTVSIYVALGESCCLCTDLPDWFQMNYKVTMRWNQLHFRVEKKLLPCAPHGSLKTAENSSCGRDRGWEGYGRGGGVTTLSLVTAWLRLVSAGHWAWSLVTQASPQPR